MSYICYRAQVFGIITTEGNQRPVGLALLLILLHFSKRERSIILLEFLPGKKEGLQGVIVEWIYVKLLHRQCLAVQVMTDWEGGAYQARYNLDPSRIRTVPFYWSDDLTDIIVRPEDRFGIFASGKNSCDWDTLLDAADGQDWPLTIVCTKKDYRRLRARAMKLGVNILSEIPRDVHDEMMRNSRLVVVPLKDEGRSSGHVRLMTAASMNVPVIAADIPGCEGYLHLAVDVYTAGDSGELRKRVNSVLTAYGTALTQQETVRTLALSRPRMLYEDQVRDFLYEFSKSDV